jgi:hemolysin activation/secretion protein
VDRLRIGVLQSLPQATRFDVDRRTRSGLATYSRNFGAVSARYEGAYRLSRASEVFLSAGGQYAWAPIPYAFKFAYGGAGYGGAFDPDALAGDNGVSGALELRRAFTQVGPVTKGRAYVRIDAGWVRSRDLAFAPQEDRAASVGVGLKADLTKRLSVQVEYNRPVIEPRFARRTGDRLLFEVIARAPA